MMDCGIWSIVQPIATAVCQLVCHAGGDAHHQHIHAPEGPEKANGPEQDEGQFGHVSTGSSVSSSSSVGIGREPASTAASTS